MKATIRIEGVTHMLERNGLVTDVTAQGLEGGGRKLRFHVGGDVFEVTMSMREAMMVANGLATLSGHAVHGGTFDVQGVIVDDVKHIGGPDAR